MVAVAHAKEATVQVSAAMVQGYLSGECELRLKCHVLGNDDRLIHTINGVLAPEL